ncbi:hypothetical protein BGX26_010794 [Mortierella sp. AD094]|nr:hypothetical protein BGX26_010794 [Mortierella sp. AD094]
MISKAEYLRNTKASEPHFVIEQFARFFEIKNAEEFLNSISTALEELIVINYNTNNDHEQSQQNERYARWKQVVETATFRASCAKFFSKKAAIVASVLEATLNLCCVVSGELASTAFPVEISSILTVGKLKKAIKEEKPSIVGDANDLELLHVTIPTGKGVPNKVISADDIEDKDKEEMMGGGAISDYFEGGAHVNTIHIIVKPSKVSSDQILKRELEENPQYASATKKIRILEKWRDYEAADGNTVKLPPEWIKILNSAEYVPAARKEFAHLKANLQVGTEIDIPSMGQAPKAIQIDSQGTCKPLITKQMLDIWKEIQDGADGNENRLYKRVLAGPMGVGKTYLSYFLAAKAYAEGWPILYIADAGKLDTKTEEKSAMQVIKYFLALNKDILTAADLGRLVRDYNGKYDISTDAASVIFEELLKWDRETLLIVDEHGKLFRNDPPVPEKFLSLNPLSAFSWWSDEYKGSRVIFTGTAHAKYEMTYLEENYRPASVIFVGPLSEDIFSKLLERYPRLNGEDVKEQVRKVTNCVPRELVRLAKFTEDKSDPIASKVLEIFTIRRANEFKEIAKGYYNKLDVESRLNFYNALLKTFLGNTSTADFDWDFLDLGLIYRLNDGIYNTTRNHILCLPAQKGLLELFKELPHHKDVLNRIRLGEHSGEEFEEAILLQLINGIKPVTLDATDLNNLHRTTISIDFEHCETIKRPNLSLGLGHERVLSRGWPDYPRFDFMLGPRFIQVSNSDFQVHEKPDSKKISKAFDDRDDVSGKNQIECYMDEMFGTGHSANMDPLSKKFIVTRNGVVVPGFQIVYIRGSTGAPNHSGLVKKYPDLLHVTFEEIKEKLFRNIL